MLNRIAVGKYASVQEMLNQPNQFSKITSRAPASLRRRRQHAPMPGDCPIGIGPCATVHRLAWRRDGRRAQLPQPRVLQSAQPRRLGQRGRGAEARYGVGNIAQYNGTAPGQLPVPPFNLNPGAGATGLQAIANQLAQNVAPEVTKFTTTLASADGGLGQFSSSIASAAKSLLGDLFKSVSRGGFAEGSLISGDGTGTSDSNLALVSDNEYVVSAGATAKHPRVAGRDNSGRTSGVKAAAFPAVSNIIASTTNSTGSDARPGVTNHHAVQNNISTPNADRFRKSSGRSPPTPVCFCNAWA